ncbi:MAG: lysylphosphatidylglycerol synthase transmembrane domain-containing protein [Candidatus Hadarchaeum sp.]
MHKVRSAITTLFLLLFGMFCLYIISVFSGLDIGEFVKVVFSIPFHLLSVWLLITLIEYILQSVRFRIICGSSQPLKDFFLHYNIGHLIAFISPSRAIGELARVFVFHKYLKISKERSLSSIVIERIFDIIVLAFASLGIVSVLSNSYLPVAFLILALFLVVFLTNHSLHSFILALVPSKHLRDFTERYFLHSRELLNDKKSFLQLFMLSVLLWMLNFIRYWSILAYFSIQIPFELSASITSISYFAVMFSVFPGGLVFFEGAGTGLLSLIGYSPAIVLSAIFVERIFSYWLWIFIGMVAFTIKE